MTTQPRAPSSCSSSGARLALSSKRDTIEVRPKEGYRLRNSARSPLIAFAILALTGCSSVGTPVLRHETGEALGSGRLRVRGRVETSRLYPEVPTGSPALGIDQGAGAFLGALLSADAAVGLGTSLDLQGSFSFLFGGAGWRLGAKYQLLKKGPLAGAVMLGYGKYSAAGTNTYNTNSGVVDVNQTLSVRQIDLSFPVSYRLGGIIPYSGLNIYNSSVEGSAANTYVSDGFTDFGVNLGVKFPIGAMFELDAEGAVLSVSDPFQGSRRMVIYYGLAGAVIF